jgi:lipid-binding SYLF domain-containing protein
MKTLLSKKSKFIISCLIVAFSFTVTAQVGGWKADLVQDSKSAINKMTDDVPKLQSFKDKSYGYVVFPKVTKAGLGIGGAAGQGILFRNNVPIGSSKLKQASFGLQAGGQQYMEVIFFENEDALNNFTNGNLKFGAQASAVAITAGASVDAAYKDGVAVFTRVRGGLMYEASIGGQHFSYKPKE